MRDHNSLIQTLEREVKIIRKWHNKSGVPRKRVSLVSGMDEHMTEVGFIPDFNAKIPRHLKDLRRRGHPDQLRAVYALGVMMGIMISTMSNQKKKVCK